MTYLSADLVVLVPSLKAVVTAVAILLVVYGQFQSDRVHDDAMESTPVVVVVEEEEDNHQTAGPQIMVVQDVYSVLSGGGDSAEGRKLQELWKNPAERRPLAFQISGWMLLIASVFLDAAEYAGVAVNWFVAAQVVVLLLLALTNAIILPVQVLGQSVHENSIFFGCVQFMGLLVWAVLLSLNGDVSMVFSCLGALLVATSWYVFWFFGRKRGDSYDRCTVENNKATVFSPGGPLLAAGWCFLWMSMNAVNSLPTRYVEIYWTGRMLCALGGVAVVTAAQFAVDYAHDEYVSADTEKGSPAKMFLLNGVLEIRIVYFLAWFLLAFTALLPTYSARLSIAVPLFFSILLQGYASSQQHVSGLRAGSEVAYQKWQGAVWAIYLVIVLLTAFHSGVWALLLSMAGIGIKQLGRYVLHHDRKRGAHWMATETVNPSYTVYSNGVLLIPVGMLVWAWGLSMP